MIARRNLRVRVAAALILPAVAACVPAAPAAPPVDAWLDGKSQSLALLGDPGVPGWPGLLQAMLDRHAGARVYHVLDATVPDTSIEDWIAAPATPGYERTVGPLQRGILRSDAAGRQGAPVPKTALWLSPPARAIDAHHGSGVAERAEAFEVLALRLRDLGFERILLGRPAGTEGEALDRLARLGHPFVFVGPDAPGAPAEVEQTTDTEALARDVAASWYRALAGDTARAEVVEPGSAGGTAAGASAGAPGES